MVALFCLHSVSSSTLLSLCIVYASACFVDDYYAMTQSDQRCYLNSVMVILFSNPFVCDICVPVELSRVLTHFFVGLEPRRAPRE